MINNGIITVCLQKNIYIFISFERDQSFCRWVRQKDVDREVKTDCYTNPKILILIALTSSLPRRRTQPVLHARGPLGPL